MPSLFERDIRDGFHRRLSRLCPDDRPRFGRLSPEAMLSHLIDTMRLTLGDVPSRPVPGPFRFPGVKHLVIGVLPWPKGRIVGPAEAFLSIPAAWSDDLARHHDLFERFGESGGRTAWPPHPMFGQMSRRLWNRFTWRHMNHHFGQFGI